MTARTDLPESVVQRVGTTIADRYRLIRVLGVGGMGAVYEAHHVFTHRRVALKLLRSEQAFSTDAASRFLQEARAPSSIGHPNIVEVLDAGVDPSVGMYLALELLEGEDLGAAVERDGIDLRTLLEVASQILSALAAAHAAGFVHRDIKPENVFVTRDASGAVRARLLDFGIVRRVSADRGLTSTGTVLGTPLYMSPEQARGEHVDARSDLWSMGAMLFHALSGSAPFDGSNVNVVLVALLTSAPPSLRDRRADLACALRRRRPRPPRRPRRAVAVRAGDGRGARERPRPRRRGRPPHGDDVPELPRGGAGRSARRAPSTAGRPRPRGGVADRRRRRCGGRRGRCAVARDAGP